MHVIKKGKAKLVSMGAFPAFLLSLGGKGKAKLVSKGVMGRRGKRIRKERRNGQGGGS